MNAPGSQIRATGTASQGSGVHHWWVQRLTSVVLIPLTVWFLVSLLALPSHDYTTVVSWLGQKWTAVLLAILIALAAWHSQLGVQVVLDDYATGKARTFSMMLSTFAHAFVAVAAILAVLRVAFGSFA
jgi:succinate dehydrogenase membrane anchor subunit